MRSRLGLGQLSTVITQVNGVLTDKYVLDLSRECDIR